MYAFIHSDRMYCTALIGKEDAHRTQGEDERIHSNNPHRRRQGCYCYQPGEAGHTYTHTR